MGVTVAAPGVALAQGSEAASEAARSPAPVLILAWAGATVLSLGLLAWRGKLGLRGSPETKSHPPHTGLTLLLCGMALWLTQMVAGTLVLVVSGADASTLRGLAIGSAGGYVISGSIAIGVWATLGRWKVRARDALKGLGLFCAWLPPTTLAGFVALSVAIWLGQEPQSIAHTTLRELAAPGAWRGSEALWWWLVVLSVTIGAPLVEEIIYRGCLQTALRDALSDHTGAPTMRGRWIAIVLTSALFAGMHLGAVDPHALAALFVLSVGFGIARERTGSVVAPIVMHALFNGVNVVVGVWG